MERGSYVAASAGVRQLTKLDIVNNNLSNLNTPGFKGQVLVSESQSFASTLASTVAANDPYARGDHERTPGVTNVRAVTDFSLGAIKNTGNPLNVALRNPNDFFVVNTPTGPQYTRAGNFTLNENGDLVTPDGFPVQGDGGSISVTGPGAKISEDGQMRVAGQSVGSLQVVRFENPQGLQRVGSSRFSATESGITPVAVDPDLVSASLEMANTSAFSNVVELMTAGRAFEMYTRTAQTIDQMNGSAISQIGKRM